MLDDLKRLLGIEETDKDLDDKLTWILNSTKARLKLLLGGIDPPDELGHVITEASVVRFNRIGSEGLTAHSVEGESLSFAENDFAGYMDEINAFLNTQDKSKRGRVRFL